MIKKIAANNFKDFSIQNLLILLQIDFLIQLSFFSKILIIIFHTYLGEMGEIFNRSEH
jgi:hypothetical protein